MSQYLTTIQQQNLLGVQYDTSKLFLWDNFDLPETIVNSGYTTETILGGTVMGRVSATGYIVPCISTATDGSQLPIGLLMNDVLLSGGETCTVRVVTKGGVATELILLSNAPTDTLNTVVSGRQYQDWLQMAGLILIGSTQNTYPDNS